ncbi:undecaprenyl diphosphate synthase family protein [Archaeoglobus veneficus]|uniref:Di-trans-poly-cis-decaprenylcistransferase n=1 Tax=Archaeoglobus veneficus (strain DSM 11195 / SNP6) TaxID=693661 RepID=F2KT08_ARCVS|nr:undecaprenyl diphosphate synthase family protein [Archaeoglobus veneficus]AEA47038.1 Di-trans-poly-cis-decaprenylcistransferase [Archaeoglobus veneficus SNP6]
MLDLIRSVYTRRLEKIVAAGKKPRHIMLVVDDLIENADSFTEFVKWCEKFGIEEITICVHDFTPELERLAEEFGCRLIHSKGVLDRQRGNVRLNVIAGLGGRAEIVEAVRKLAELVEKGELEPEEVDEELIEAFLRIKSPPDLIVRAGALIPDFLIWQSIYSEMHFLDMDWKSFRYIDFLRCLRDYQRRERRYGR